MRLTIGGLIFSAGLLVGATQASAAPLLQFEILSRNTAAQIDGVSGLLNGVDFIGPALSEGRPASRLNTGEFDSNGSADTLLAYVAGSPRTGADNGALGTWVSEFGLLNTSERSNYALRSGFSRYFGNEGNTPHFDLYETYLRLCANRGCDSLQQRDLDRFNQLSGNEGGSMPPIPEPATLVLLATGLAISARSLRRRRPANK